MDEKPTDFAPVDEQTKTQLKVSDDEMVGREIAHTFVLEKCLGRGGMGVVYQARHLLLNKLVALKLLNQTAAGAPGVVERFRREAVAISSLDHLNIVRLNAFDVDENDQAYLVMDLVEGQSLSELIRERGKLPPQETLSVASQVLAALAHAHSHHIIHRDIKPANIMVLPLQDGSLLVKVVDFGLAKILGPADGQSQSLSLTKSGEMLGSPLYMSPEQCTGDPLDERSDIYSIGCVLYEMLTGQPPFSADNFLKILHLHATGRHKAISDKDVPATIETALNQLLNKAMAKGLDSRYQSANAMRSEIEKILRSDWAITSPEEPLSAALARVKSNGNDMYINSNTRSARRSHAEANSRGNVKLLIKGIRGVGWISILVAMVIGLTIHDFFALTRHATIHTMSQIIAGKHVDAKVFDLENLSVIDPDTARVICFKGSMTKVEPLPFLLGYGQIPAPYTRDDSTINGGIPNIIPSDEYFAGRIKALSRLNGRSFSAINSEPLIEAANWFYDCGDMGRALCYYQKLQKYAELNGKEKAQISAKLGDCYMYFNLFDAAGQNYLKALSRLNQAEDEQDIFLLSQVELKLAYCQKIVKTLPDEDFAMKAYKTRQAHAGETSVGIENEVVLGDINLMRGAASEALLNYDKAVPAEPPSYAREPEYSALQPYYTALIELRKAKAYLALQQPEQAIIAMSRAQAATKAFNLISSFSQTTAPQKQVDTVLPRIYYTIGLANEQMHKLHPNDWSAYQRALDNFELALTTAIKADPSAKTSAFAEMCLEKLSRL